MITPKEAEEARNKKRAEEFDVRKQMVRKFVEEAAQNCYSSAAAHTFLSWEEAEQVCEEIREELRSDGWVSDDPKRPAFTLRPYYDCGLLYIHAGFFLKNVGAQPEPRKRWRRPFWHI